MAKLNHEWAIAEIDLFLRATDQVRYDNAGGGGVVLGTHMRGSKTEASERAHVLEKILDRVLPDWSKDRPEKDSTYDWLHDQLSRSR
jgi:hypothetical protein